MCLPMKKAMESLRWVAYEEYVECSKGDSDDEEVKANDITESSGTDDRTDDDEVSEANSKDDDSESAESVEEG